MNLAVCAYFKAYDQKNIRRRVYDALNVLMAMNIISKEKKEIKWVGLPTNSAQECQQLEVCVEELTLSLKLNSVLDMFAFIAGYCVNLRSCSSKVLLHGQQCML